MTGWRARQPLQPRPPASSRSAEPALIGGALHALDREGEGSRSHRALVARHHRADLLVGGDHVTLELLVDLLLRPAVLLEVLDPFEVADGDAAGVRPDVRKT